MLTFKKLSGGYLITGAAKGATPGFIILLKHE